MALLFRYRKKARIDFYEAADWYEEQVGKGQEFLDDFIKTLQKIQANPDTYRKVYQDCRRIQFNRFPYYVVYKVGKKVISSLAVYHNKRNDTWKRRVH